MTHLGIILVLCLALGLAALAAGEGTEKRWSAEKANAWYARQPWLVGCNFINSNAINQLEMFQADTWDPKTIDRELGWARALGFNTVRTYLHDLAWEQDAEGFKKRLDEFLGLCAKHKIRPMLVIFDDCWNRDPKPGKQPEPVPGVHNSGWLQSPGQAKVNDPKTWWYLERYVTDLMTSFGKDDRILMWDLYNEPGNTKQGDRSLPLLKAVFEWARAGKPQQPLSVGVWSNGLKNLNAYQLAQSDVITFHNYSNAKSLKGQIKGLREHGRPVICTEWMRRPVSAIPTHLSIFAREKVGCYNWGLVSGKTNTIFPWGSKKNAPEPKRWFHDLLRADGMAYDAKEIEQLKKTIQETRK